MPDVMLALAVAAFVAVNIVTIWCFHTDKARAISGAWRIREADLLALAAIGGTPGAFLARRWFRHKTRKQPFSTYLALIAAAQTGTALSFLF